MIITDTDNFVDYKYTNKLSELTENLNSNSSYAWRNFSKPPEFSKIKDCIIGDSKLKLQLHMENHFGNSGLVSLFSLSEDCILSLRMTSNVTSIDIFSSNPGWNKEIIGRINEYIETLMLDKTDESLVGVTFCYMTPMGPNHFYRNIACPQWKEIKQNYTDPERIEWLLRLESPDKHGKLIFWHGVPGTGKTYSIRALMRAWRSKADFLYVLDPEALFADSGYLLDTLMHEPYHAEYEEVDMDESPSESSGKRLKVLVIEDALDLLLKENRKKKSSAMARLLNLTEGIVGQGFKVLVLITSNEEIKTIDPAFTRVGRCLQVLEYKPFSAETGFKWLETRGYDPSSLDKKKIWTLADLYAVLKDAEFSMYSSIFDPRNG